MAGGGRDDHRADSHRRTAATAGWPARRLPGCVIHRALAHTGGSDGAALLAAALAAGADGLAMGAYRSGRMLERMLGDVTEHVLQHATLPLLLMH